MSRRVHTLRLQRKMPGIFSSNSCFGQVERSSKSWHGNYNSSTSWWHNPWVMKIFLFIRSLFFLFPVTLDKRCREAGKVLYAQSAFIKVLLYPILFAPKLQEDLSAEWKPINCRLHFADQDTSTSKGQCQGAPSVALTETLGRPYMALLRGETTNMSCCQWEHVHSTRDRQSKKATLLTCELSSMKMSMNKLCRWDILFSQFGLPAAPGWYNCTANGEAGMRAAWGILNQQMSTLPNNLHLVLQRAGQKLPRPSFSFNDDK